MLRIDASESKGMPIAEPKKIANGNGSRPEDSPTCAKRKSRRGLLPGENVKSGMNGDEKKNKTEKPVG